MSIINKLKRSSFAPVFPSLVFFKYLNESKKVFGKKQRGACVVNVRYMRIILFFDLPTKSKKQRKAYMNFRKYLLDDGYDMLQFSVYCRICKGVAAVEKHRQRIKAKLPKSGNIRFLVVTNSTYEKMELLIGANTEQETNIGKQSLIIF